MVVERNRPPLHSSYVVSADTEPIHKLIGREIRAFLYEGDCLKLLAVIPPESMKLIITSPPYNIGKEYETEQQSLKEYLEFQAEVIAGCVRALDPTGSICWQVGNHVVNDGEVLPLDIVLHPLFKKLGLKMRNRIVWHFEHGLHCQRRLSGRYEVLMWFTKSDEYTFNLDPVRGPQKYPGKRHFKGPKTGELSGNPLGKNPSDVWIFPNVKNNHIEKTAHPCQFPVELVDRMLLATTDVGDAILDPFAGVSTTLAAALLRDRVACGAEIKADYVEISKGRMAQAIAGTLPVRPTGTPVYQPTTERIAQIPAQFLQARFEAIGGSAPG